MSKFEAYRWNRAQFVRWVGTNTPFDAQLLRSVILRELRYRRLFPRSVSPCLLVEIAQEFRMSSAILKAYPDLNNYHTRLMAVQA